jgi:agmatine/peptidylarginine deiminase
VLTFLPLNGTRRKRYLKQLEEIRHVLAGQRVIVHESTAPEVDVQCHLNMYWINGAVVVPSCGDELDDERFADLLRSRVPERKVEFVDVPQLGSGGGWVHCATLHEPLRE